MPATSYFDDDSESKAVAKGLTNLGFVVVRATEAGMRGKPDEVHLAYATAHEMALVTANRADFLRLHASWMAIGESTPASSSCCNSATGPENRSAAWSDSFVALPPVRCATESTFLSNWPA